MEQGDEAVADQAVADQAVADGDVTNGEVVVGDEGLSDDDILGDATRRLRAGIRVEVRSRFDRSWGKGFEVVGVAPDGYIIRRLSDGEELPARFSRDDVRRERRSGNWWF